MCTLFHGISVICVPPSTQVHVITKVQWCLVQFGWSFCSVQLVWFGVSSVIKWCLSGSLQFSWFGSLNGVWGKGETTLLLYHCAPARVLLHKLGTLWSLKKAVAINWIQRAHMKCKVVTWKQKRALWCAGCGRGSCTTANCGCQVACSLNSACLAD
jgi:hypothetical protein